MKTDPEIQAMIMTEFVKAGARAGDSLSPEFMHQLNSKLDRNDQEHYQQAVTKLFEAGLIGLSGTSLQLTKKGWDYLQEAIRQ